MDLIDDSFARLSNVVRNKGRAVSIRVDEVAGVSGWVRPHDHVDVLYTGPDRRTKELATNTIHEDVIVLATGPIAGSTNVIGLKEEDRKYTTVTLHALPREAEILALASRSGTLSLCLRNPDDTTTRERESRATLRDLTSAKTRKKLLEERKKVFRILRPSSIK